MSVIIRYMNIIFINARIFLGEPAIIRNNQYLVVSNCIIEEFGLMDRCNMAQYRGYAIIDCENKLICPGFIDVHVHFRDPGALYKEDIESGTRSAAAAGFTTVVCMPNTSPTIDSASTARYLKQKIREFAKVNVKFYSAATSSLAGEFISPIQTMLKEGAIGFTDDGQPIHNSKIMKTLFQYSAEFACVIAQHAEDHSLSGGGCVGHGKFADQYNLKTIDDASEYSVIARDLALLDGVKGARYHVLHVSCKKSLQHIKWAKDRGLEVTVEITPHHFILTNNALYESYQDAKMNPPLRLKDDVDAMINAMADGTIDMIASDHAPHDSESKSQPIGCAPFGIIGLETMLALSLELYHQKRVSLERILQMLTIKPAILIGEDKIRGRIEKGYIADLSVIDENFEWTIDQIKINSKSKNSPFNGRNVKGISVMTMLGGKIIYPNN